MEGDDEFCEQRDVTAEDKALESNPLLAGVLVKKVQGESQSLVDRSGVPKQEYASQYLRCQSEDEGGYTLSERVLYVIQYMAVLLYDKFGKSLR